MAAERFGPYELVGLIGRGGMGEVHRAVDTRKNRGQIALKRLPAGLATDTEFQRRFLREAELAARLRDPHVIPIHDYGQIDGHPYLDMRLVDGTDLATALARGGPLDPARAVAIIGQVAAALDAAHTEGLVHRDVKPQNVLLADGNGSSSGSDFVYLIDFGIAANLLTSSRSSSMVSGTAAYMAPERFSTGGDHRVDVYALGAVLFELLTGRTPYAGDFLQLMNAHVNTPPPRPSAVRPELPGALDGVVTTALAKDPDQRHPSAGALATAARQAIRPTPPPSAPPSRPPSPPPGPSNVARVGGPPAVTPRPGQRPVPPRPPLVPARPPSPYRRAAVLAVVVALLAAVVTGIVVGLNHVTSITAGSDSTTYGTHLALLPGARTGFLLTNGLGTTAGLVEIDLRTKQRIAAVNISGNLTDVAVSPDGRRAYVAQAQPGANALLIVDQATHALVATVPVTSPSDVEVSPDGATVYLVNGFGAGTVSVVDAATDTVTRTIEGLDGAEAMAVAPDGRHAYVATDTGLAVIDTSTGAVTARIAQAPGTSAFGVRVSPDGRSVYTADDGGRIYGPSTLTVVDTASNAAVATLGLGGRASGTGITPDGSRVLVATEDSGAGSLYSIDTARNAVGDRSTAAYPWPSQIVVTPDGRQAYYFPSEQLETVDL